MTTNKFLAIAFLLLSTTALPVKAQTLPSESTPAKTAPNPVAETCIQNRAETLPSPFTDVPSNHWAFKAVMTMHYCGAFRQAATPELFQKFTPTPTQQQSQAGKKNY